MEPNIISFESDYNNGMLPEILEALTKTNDEKTSGYGFDPYTERAKQKIRLAVGNDKADVFLLVGGTQTNATVIDSLLMPCEGVICTEMAHIAVHEAGAIEASGHKVITLPSANSKINIDALKAYMDKFLADGTYPHMVQPGMVYITMPTEHGMIYMRNELTELYDVCRHYGLKLYVDGARLGYGLMSEVCDYDLPFLAAHCDAFYIGGTKVGALMGEAVVFSNIPAPKYFFTTIKRHGALLAKGRMLGVQFDVLFTNNLYFRIAQHAIEMARRLKDIFTSAGIPLAVDSPTNQQFVVLSRKQYEKLSEKIKFEIWEPSDTDEIVCRFVTSWATSEKDVEGLKEALAVCVD